MATTDPQRAGDIGNLALADATLGALLIDLAVLVAEANYPEPPTRVNRGMTTGQAAQAVEHQAECYPDLFPDGFGQWLAEVAEVADLRNRILHAVAVNACTECGTATLFRHPRSGDHVDRTAETVHAVTDKAEQLHRQGVTLAEGVADLVNARIMALAREAAEATNEVQNPPQVHAYQPVHLCADCAGDRRGSITIRVGTAVEVWPREKFQMLKEELAKPHAERDYERWQR